MSIRIRTVDIPNLKNRLDMLYLCLEIKVIVIEK